MCDREDGESVCLCIALGYKGELKSSITDSRAGILNVWAVSIMQ